MNRRFVSAFISLVMISGFLPIAIGGGTTEKSMSGTINVIVGPDALNISSRDGTQFTVTSQYTLEFQVFHSNWTCMNGSTGPSQPQVTVYLWNDYDGGSRGSADDAKTHYTFRYLTNDSSVGKAGCNGWYEVGPDAGSDSHLISVTNTSNISDTDVGNDPVKVSYVMDFEFNPNARYSNATAAVGQWFLSVEIQDNESQSDVYDNATEHYNSYYGQIDISDTTWSVTMRPGQSQKNESESSHTVTYTCNYDSLFEGRGDKFNHSTGYGSNKYILPDNISIAAAKGGSTSLNVDPTTDTVMSWGNPLSVSLNQTIDFRHQVDLSGAANLQTGSYTGNTYLKIRQRKG